MAGFFPQSSWEWERRAAGCSARFAPCSLPSIDIERRGRDVKSVITSRGFEPSLPARVARVANAPDPPRPLCPALGMDCIPRQLSRAQTFDALCSMANIAGYR